MMTGTVGKAWMLLLLLLATAINENNRLVGVSGFQLLKPQTHHQTTTTTTITTRLLSPTNNNLQVEHESSQIKPNPIDSKRNQDNNGSNSRLSSSLGDDSKQSAAAGRNRNSLQSFAVAMALWSAVVLFPPLFNIIGNTQQQAAYAYSDNDYASETVQTTIQKLKDASGNQAETFKAYETLADIITEGSGLGGSVNFQGVTLDRGYVADEDTAIYNPGLTLLTESEKERLVKAVIASRSAGVQANTWNGENQLAFEFLREKLDPYHMQELSGYLGIFPFYAAVVYLAVLGVQQLARDFFPVAYIVGVVAVLAPALVLVLLGTG